MSPAKRPRLTGEQRAEITRRALAGENQVEISEEFGVTRACVSLLKAQALFPERYEKKRWEMARKLSDAELAEFRAAVLKSTPVELGLDPLTKLWCMDHGYQLAKRMFGKNPGVRVMRECMEPVLPRGKPEQLRRPQPPEPHAIEQLAPEFANDPDFVAYYLSPICEQIARREYEISLKYWIARHGDVEEIEPAEDEPEPLPPAPPAPGRRIGRHAGSKGSPFTQSKRKQRKKGRR